MTAATQPATPAAPNNNEPVRVNHTARNVIITIVVVAIIAVASFFGYRAFAGANESSAKGSKGNPVKIGVVGATNPEWVKFKQDAEKAGIYVDIVDFQDYTSENPALDSGELDLNEFQHLLYLANYNVSNKKDLQPIGGTAIYPLGVYSTKVKDIKDLKQGDTVTIPNDETNQARAIGVLKAAGLVTLKGDWTAFSTPGLHRRSQEQGQGHPAQGRTGGHHPEGPDHRRWCDQQRLRGRCRSRPEGRHLPG